MLVVVYFYECRNTALAKGMLTVDVDDAEARQAAKVYKALGELTRLRIVQLLLVDEDKDYCASAIGEKLETVASSTLSHHLKQLMDCGLLNQWKMGTYIFYRVNRHLVRKYAPFLLQ
jgi:DNA-binding transcriptional ArsR family regulator